MNDRIANESGSIPVPRTEKPLGRIDQPFNSDACIDMVSVLYHAEKAALEAFEHLNDPLTVENCDVFLQARPMLLADELAHLNDMEEIIRLMGGSGVRPPLPGFDELWSIEGARRQLSFPLRARVAALFTLVTESLGYAYLYHLSQAMVTANVRIAQLLAANVRDEERHIEVSMEVLRCTLSGRERLAGFDLLLHLFAFLLMSRRAAKTMLTLLKQVGFDPFILAASSMQFTCTLLLQVAGKAQGDRENRRLGRILRFTLSPTAMRFYCAGCYIPVLPAIWPPIRGLSRLVHRFSV